MSQPEPPRRYMVEDVTDADQFDMREFGGGTITLLSGTAGARNVEQLVAGNWVPLNLNGAQVTITLSLNAAEIMSDAFYHAGILRFPGSTGNFRVEKKF